jgi:4-alpha-glucanotransferase
MVENGVFEVLDDLFKWMAVVVISFHRVSTGCQILFPSALRAYAPFRTTTHDNTAIVGFLRGSRPNLALSSRRVNTCNVRHSSRSKLSLWLLYA